MRRFLLGLLLILSSIHTSAAEETESLETSLRPLMEQAETIEVTLTESNLEAQKAAEALFQLFQSNEYQARIQRERLRLAEEFFGARRSATEEQKEKAREDASRPPVEGRIYLFVSSSMPMNTLRNYVADVARLNDPRFALVLRGFVGGAKRIAPTAAFIAEALKEDPHCEMARHQECALREVAFIVDPTLFRRSGIEKVPAIAFIPEGKGGGETLVLYGDASLGYGLELLARETGDTDLGQLAQKLKPIP